MFQRGDFGNPKKQSAKEIKADILYNMDEWMSLNPDKDPSEFVTSYTQKEIAEREASKLNAMFGLKKENAFKKRIAKEDADAEVLGMMLQERGKDVNALSDEQIDLLILTPEFNKYKTELLQ